MKRNDMQIGEKDIKNLFMTIMLEGEVFFLKRHLSIPLYLKIN
jgi:hypothetical protein